MLYEKSLAIGHRLEDLVRLLRSKKHSAPALAKQLGVSVPTLSRDIIALRQRGYCIRSVRLARRWAYEMVSEPGEVPQT
ncbi:HTH domain-containing protein [Gemmata sp. G18]|uniref:HTH domain-containing protein n=1 Tax=Gemmata palustris TaxID=2822762 RepID=A0ABS5BPW1_9BACT|nr:HTH domain-containing protein [Gemmata palustris]